MTSDHEDAAYDAYLTDWKAELDQLLEGFGSFWVAHTKLLQAAGMVVTEYLGIGDHRRHAFGELILEELSLSRLAAMLKSIINDVGASKHADLPKEMQRVAAFRNRIAHDALLLQTDPRDGWPTLSKKSLFGPDDHEAIPVEELENLVTRCEALQEELLNLLVLVAQAE